jgi:excisionase family DNA binding protein
MALARHTSTMSARPVSSTSADPLSETGRAEVDSPVRVRVAERVVITTQLDPFLPLRALAAYVGLSVRTLRQYLDLPPNEALPCYRVGGKILVRRSQFDAWIAQYQTRGRPALVRALQDFGLDTGDH